MKINYNNELINADSAILSAANRSFRYGDGLFESIKVINGRPQFLERHLARLYKGLELLQIEFDSRLTLHRLEASIQDLLAANGIHEGGRLRLTVYRSGEGFYRPEKNTAHFLIEAEKGPNHYELNDEGLKVQLFPNHLKPIQALGQVKSANALLYILAAKYAEDSGVDDALILNEYENICEGSASNVFAVKNGVLFTPSRDQGFVPGILRERIIYMAKSNRIPFEERKISKATLKSADELFLCNAVAGIRWVKAFEEKRYYSKLSRRLNELLNG